VPGEDNCVADALSRLPDDPEFDHQLPPDTDNVLLAAVFSIASDTTLLNEILKGYNNDPFCIKLTANQSSVPDLQEASRLLYLGSRLVIPRIGQI